MLGARQKKCKTRLTMHGQHTASAQPSQRNARNLRVTVDQVNETLEISALQWTISDSPL